MGTTTNPSSSTSSGGMDAALSVTTVTGMKKRAYDGPRSIRGFMGRGLPRLAGQRHGSCHMREMADALGEVAEERAILGVDLFGEQPHVVGRARRPLEHL